MATSGLPSFFVSSEIGLTRYRPNSSSRRPASVTAGVAFGVSVSDEYATGVVIQDVDSGQATIELGNDPGGDPLSGTMTAPFHAGVATFSGLTLDHAANGYTFRQRVTAWARPSGSFNVVAAAGTQLLITTEPKASLLPGRRFGLTAEVEDRFGNLATGYNGTVTAIWRPIRAEARWAARPRRCDPSSSTPAMRPSTDLSSIIAGNGYTLTLNGYRARPHATTTGSMLCRRTDDRRRNRRLHSKIEQEGQEGR